jgi:hypothetical protein
VISPILSNIFLHHVLDEWYERDVKPRMKGQSFLLRFANDFVIGFEREDDARRVMAVLPKRFGRVGLTIHPTKTALIPFQRPRRRRRSARGNGTLDFLGFTHYWARSRRGCWVMKRHTAKKRLRRTMKAVWVWCRNNRHRPLEEQYRALCIKLRGALSVLRRSLQLRTAECGAPVRRERLALLAQPAQPQGVSWLGAVPPTAGEVSPSPTQDRPLHLNALAGQQSCAPERCQGSGYRGTG